MKLFPRTIAPLIALVSWLVSPGGLAAQSSPALLKAKQEAEARGYTFETSRDEIVAKAKKEKKLKVLSGFGPESFKPLAEAFRQKFPFIDITVEELAGQEAAQRFLLEMKSGVAVDWDVINFFGDFFADYLPFGKKMDILGMARQRVLDIPEGMIDPQNRNLVAAASSLIVVAYNKSRISQEKVPNSWEGFLKPEFKGGKFIVDIKGVIADMAACPEKGMGLEWLLDYSKKLAAQNPVWVRGSTSVIRLSAGEYPMHSGYYLHNIVGHQRKDVKGNLAYKFIDPVPAHLYAPDGVFNAAAHPYAGLLWLEFLAGSEGQRIIDSGEPGKASLFSTASIAGKSLKGKRSCVVGWESFNQLGEWRSKVIAAFGFPKAEMRK